MRSAPDGTLCELKWKRNHEDAIQTGFTGGGETIVCCHPEQSEGCALGKGLGESRFLTPFKRRTGFGMTIVGISLQPV